MITSVVTIETETDADEARKIISELATSTAPSDIARLKAQAMILEAYEADVFPAEAISSSDIVQYILDQHGLTPADLVPVMGTRSRVSEVLRGQRGFSLTMIRKIVETYGISAEVLIASQTSKLERFGTERHTKSAARTTVAAG